MCSQRLAGTPADCASSRLIFSSGTSPFQKIHFCSSHCPAKRLRDFLIAESSLISCDAGFGGVKRNALLAVDGAVVAAASVMHGLHVVRTRLCYSETTGS